MIKEKYRIISIRENPCYAMRAVDWFSSKWGIDRKEYEISVDECINKDENLPRWYLVIDEKDEIAGGCGLIQNDFVDRTDLFPYLCALFVEKKDRGNALGEKLLEHVRRDAEILGFDKVYLCTDHTSYYEKYGWKYITVGYNPSGEPSRIYEAETIKSYMPERMDEFFAKRVDEYDDHMLNNVPGCRQAYVQMAKLIPTDTQKLLDLGCGTGIELEEIFKRLPDISVVGIDLTKAMLNKLAQKYADKNIQLILNSYFNVELGKNAFDVAVSFQTMHHFDHKSKLGLYEKIYKALSYDGMYIECDYMVLEQSEEDRFFSEYEKLRKDNSILEGEFYHFDTPCTISNQIKLLEKAGFSKVCKVWRMENTTILTASK